MQLLLLGLQLHSRQLALELLLLLAWQAWAAA